MLHLQSVSPCRWPSTKVRTPSCFRIGVEVTTEEDAERLTQDHRVCKDLGHQGLNSGGHTTSQSTQVHIVFFRFLFLQTCLRRVSYDADMTELVLRVIPTGVSSGNVPS